MSMCSRTSSEKLQRSFENMWDTWCRISTVQGVGSDTTVFSSTTLASNSTGKILSLSKIGNVKLRLSREIPEDAIVKTLSIKKSVSGWYACFAVDVPMQPLPQSDAVVGIDLGIENFAALSDGTMIQNPRVYEHGQAELRGRTEACCTSQERFGIADTRRSFCFKNFRNTSRASVWIGLTRSQQIWSIASAR